MSHAVVKDAQQRAGAWAYLGNLDVDVALVQEASQPTGVMAQIPLASADWGTYVVGYRTGLEPLTSVTPTWTSQSFQIPTVAREGTLSVALSDRQLVAISLYGMLRYADQSVIRAASDILPIFDSKLRKNVVLGGDLNIHTHSGVPAERRRAKPELALLESFGLQNLLRLAKTSGNLHEGDHAIVERCPCDGTDCYHVRTHRHGRHTPGAMANNDYLFASPALAQSLVELEVRNGDADVAWTLSDHAPLIATFSL